MDILNPELVWIEGRCYRKLAIKSKELSSNKPLPVMREIIEHSYEDDERSDLMINMDNNRFWIRFPIPKQLMGFIIGKGYATKNQIESQTSTKVIIPKEKSQESDIVIIGDTKKSVSDAYTRIESIAYAARWRVGNYTHFISIPVNNDDIQKGFLEFKREVLQNCQKNDGISESTFVPPAKLHLTIAMLTLLDSREKETAKELLQKQKMEILNIIGGKELRVEVKGIEYMNDDPGEVNVLYGKVRETDSDNSLQLISDKLADAFAKINFSRKEKEAVKLHVTLMKSKDDDARQRTTFDARKILEAYADYSFGQMTVTEIHISVRFTGGDNYFLPSFVLSLKS